MLGRMGPVSVTLGLFCLLPPWLGGSSCGVLAPLPCKENVGRGGLDGAGATPLLLLLTLPPAPLWLGVCCGCG